MATTTRLALIVLIGLGCPTPVRAQALWQGTAYGMSVEEAHRALPVSAPPKGTPERLGNHAEERLRVENVEVAHRRFTASLFFLDGKLCQVTLALRDRLPFSSTTLVFDAMVDALRAKYGRELSDRTRVTGSLRTRSADWLSGRTNINVFALAQDDTPALLNVNYQFSIAKDADKL